MAGQDLRVDIPGLGRGALVTIETIAPRTDRTQAVKVPQSLEFPAQGVVQLQTRRNADRTEAAVLFVPDSARGYLRNRIQAYGGNVGNQRRPDLERFEVVERIRAAAAASLFPSGTDFASPAAWWEFWVRQPNAVADAVANRARVRELDVHPDRLEFPDTAIVLVHASRIASGWSVIPIGSTTAASSACWPTGAGKLRPSGWRTLSYWPWSPESARRACLKSRFQWPRQTKVTAPARLWFLPMRAAKGASPRNTPST